MQITTLSLLAVLIAFICQFLRRWIPEYAVIVSTASGIFFLTAVFSSFLPVIQRIQRIFDLTAMPDAYEGILLKTVGICMIVQFASDTCRDVGENGLAEKIELAAKIVITVLALPLFEALLSLITSLLQ